MIFDTISVKVRWEQPCRWNWDLRVINAQKTGIFCCTESVAMMLKIMCTYAHYVILGSHCKMASNHRVTDLGKNPVRISKDEALTPLSVVGPLFISSFFISSFLSLVRCVAFQSFSFCLAFATGWTSSGLGVLFYFLNLSLFHHM